jgi:catechol 2,3-dioxygenase-like lactoylglutathione lyase family enzyme
VAPARITGLAPQLRTTDLDASIRFYVDKLGFALAFRWEDFYAGICSGAAEFHLKRVDARDPSIDHVAEGDHVHLYFHVDDLDALLRDFSVRGVVLQAGPLERAWGAREAILRDDQGHTLYFSQSVREEQPA